MKKAQFAYLLARLPIGMAFFGHGLIRFTKLSMFSHWMVGQFSKSFIPGGLVLAFGYVLPFLEFIVGLLLLMGLFTRFAIVLGAVIILMLIFGSCMIEQWDNAFVQMIYGAYLAGLFYFVDYNGFGIDSWVKKR
ncbi:MAG TPA: DoxX family membrane protein [Mucilaginibacter sp.]